MSTTEILVRCERCKQLNPLKKLLVERALPAPYDQDKAVEGLLICPDCGFEKHSYFLSDAARWERTRIVYQISELGAESSAPDRFNRIQSLRKEYAKIFDDEQQKYSALLEKVAT